MEHAIVLSARCQLDLNDFALKPNRAQYTAFWEVGASGKCYNHEEVITLLLGRYATEPVDAWETEQWKTTDFRCQEVAPYIYLLTYQLQQKTRITRRATLWRLEAESWKIVYHQPKILS